MDITEDHGRPLIAARSSWAHAHRRRPKLFVTRHFLPEVNGIIDRRFDAWGARDAPWCEADLIAGAQGADAMLVCLSEKITAGVINALPDALSVIATASIGLDHIDLDAASRRGFSVINAPGAGTVSTAELAFLLILGACRNASQGERLVREGRWGGWHPTHLLGAELAGKRLGIFGMGRIGREVAQRARAFGLEVHYCNRSRLPATL